MIRAFTGPSRLTKAQACHVAKDIQALYAVEEVRTGGATGVDTKACEASVLALPGARHVAYLPAAHHNGANLPLEVECIQCPDMGSRAANYRVRNEWMLYSGAVADIFADELVAYVREPTFYRSGEWMTINIARRYGVRVDMRVLP